jgi:serine/threonine protein kinase
MEDRYEIRGKIGQGGLGAVYRGYDMRMNREVAIKRISVANDDPALQEESTRQLLKEAGALASLQHPHVVTIYDVGSDEDGPYAVMELISGNTLDELIDQAPLTWNDFREIALQTQEALIAAQELDLIHGDIKPQNLMLTWLPSGRFQIKIVDFGLATLAQSQSPEELQAIDTVFGSIFFMAPEQFERSPMDARTDIYAMGCVYYQALTGHFPYSGETAHEVMESHLAHKVTPLQEVRADIPVWACDWIMWLINRQPTDRPASARESLQLFLQNDKQPTPQLSLGRPAPKPGAARRGPPLAPHARAAQLAAAPAAEPALTITAPPQPLLPPEGSKPSVHTGPQELPSTATTAHATHTAPLHPTEHGVATKQIPAHPTKPKPKLGPKKIAVLASSVIVLLILGFLLLDRIKKSQASQRYGNLLTQAAESEVSEIPMSGEEFSRLLKDAAETNSDAQQKNIFQALSKAKPNDGADFGSATADFAIKTVEILPEVRAALISNGLAGRVKPALIPQLMDFARATKDIPSAIAIFAVIRPIAGDEQFDSFLDVALYSPNADFRMAAEESAVAVIKKSSNKGKLLGKVAAVMGTISDKKIKESLMRIRKAGGG